MKEERPKAKPSPDERDDVRIAAQDRCPFCHDDISIRDGRKHGCPDCMAWHHVECWESHGGCSSCGLEASKTAEQPVPAHEPPPRARTARRLFKEALAGVALLTALLLGAGFFVTHEESAERRALAPRLGQLVEKLPGHERIGLLLPVEDLGAPERGWARIGRQLSSKFPAERVVFDLWTPSGLAMLYERGKRNELASANGCTLAIHTVVPRHAGALEADAIMFVVDLSSYEIRAATAVADPVALKAAAFVASTLGPNGPGPVVVVPTIDAKLRVSNSATAEFDARLTAALVAARPKTPIRARAGLVPRLRGFNSDVVRAVSATVVVACEYDHEAMRLRVSVLNVNGGARSLGDSVITVDAPFRSYDPTADARLFSLDVNALALIEHSTPSEVVAAALQRARAHLHEHKAESAEALLEALLARADVADTSRPAVLLLLAEARLDQGQFAGAQTAFEEALKLDPLDPKTQALYARACLDEAERLFALGKRPWYENDDEDLLATAHALLTGLDALTQIDEALRADVRALAERLAKEL